MLTREKLIELIHKNGLAEFETQILNLAQPAIYLKRQRISDESSIPVGASKLGGSPDLPEGFEWKSWNGYPLTFIAQFKLSELAPYDTLEMLPKQGMLWFFYEATTQPSENIAAFDCGCAQVFCNSEEGAVLKRTPHPTLGDFQAINRLFLDRGWGFTSSAATLQGRFYRDANYSSRFGWRVSHLFT